MSFAYNRLQNAVRNLEAGEGSLARPVECDLLFHAPPRRAHITCTRRTGERMRTSEMLLLWQKRSHRGRARLRVLLKPAKITSMHNRFKVHEL